MIVILATLLQGCSIPKRQPPVPQDMTEKAEIPGMPDIRYFVSDDQTKLILDAQKAVKLELAYRARTGQNGPLPPANFLVLSGGGDDGAYGAGLLCGWTDSGTRPEFKLVTGISTGALIAPFAFLGSEYDTPLREVFTNSSPKDILEKRSPLAAVLDDALNDNKPLWKLIQKHISEEMLHKIAQEYDKGRILLIATTILDTQRPIIWNMTKIAASNHPQALDLFRKLMIASAAIPGAFPPTMIDVEVDGKPFQEMHVDGGTVSQVFVYPPSFKLDERIREIGIQRERNLYIIRNSRLDTGWSAVERRSLTIAMKAISSLIRTQGIGDLYRIYLNAQRDHIDYNLAFIPSTFNMLHKEDFDREYMQQLFRTGYDAAVNGYHWAKTPPRFE